MERTDSDGAVPLEVNPSSRDPHAQRRHSTEPLVQEIIDELRPLMARQRRAMTEHWDCRALSTTNLHLLMILEHHGQLAMSRLAELHGTSLPTMTGIIDRMEDRALVERIRDPSDRRIVLVKSTAAGHAAVEEFEFIRRRHLVQLLEVLTMEERRQCLSAFRLMSHAVDRLGDTLRD